MHVYLSLLSSIRIPVFVPLCRAFRDRFTFLCPSFLRFSTLSVSRLHLILFLSRSLSYLLFMTWNVMYVRIMQFCCKKNVNLINPMFNYRFYLNSFKVINIYDILFLLKIIRIACHLSFLFTHSYTSFSFLFLFFYFSTSPVFILYSLLFYRLRFFSFFSSSLLSHLHSTPFLSLIFLVSFSVTFALPVVWPTGEFQKEQGWWIMSVNRKTWQVRTPLDLLYRQD